ncbi:MAG: hypothetical protein ACJ8J0_16475 [Longimicrobiaceae bacterium]
MAVELRGRTAIVTGSSKGIGFAIAEAAFAVEMMASPGDVALTIHTHPTLGEGMAEAFKHALGEAIHIMNRRAAPRPVLAAA